MTPIFVLLISLAPAFVMAAWFRTGRMRLIFLAAASFTALAVLAFGINSDFSVAVDTSVADWFDAHRTRRRDAEAAGAFGYLGRPFHVLAAALVIGVPLSLRRRSPLPLALICGAVAVGALVEHTLKATIGRTTASELLPYYAHSFPSGHVTGAAALVGSIGVCLGAGGSRAIKNWLAGLVVTSVLVVAGLALYTGAHTFTDVLGGAFLGAGIVAACGAVYGGPADDARVATLSRRDAALRASDLSGWDSRRSP